MLTGGVCRGAKRARGGPARQIDEVDDDGRGWGRRPAATSRGTPAQPSACIRCRRGRRCSSTSSRAPGRLVATSTVTARRWRSDDRGGKRASEEEGNGWGRQGDWRGDRGVEAWQPYPLAGFIAGEGGSGGDQPPVATGSGEQRPDRGGGVGRLGWVDGQLGRGPAGRGVFSLFPFFFLSGICFPFICLFPFLFYFI